MQLRKIPQWFRQEYFFSRVYLVSMDILWFTQKPKVFDKFILCYVGD